ncbi:MAG: radical SAM protein, partial [Bdellovibrionota bacterium]
MPLEPVDILLIIPPLTQMNTPYPATAYLTGYLRKKGFAVAQADLGLELLLKLFCRKGIASIVTEIKKNKSHQGNESLQFFVESADDYAATIEPVIRFLQGRDPSLALRLANRQLVPEGPRFLPLLDHPELLEFFGQLGTQDKAKYIASLYIDDISDAIRDGVDADFELAKYGERLASSTSSFDALYERLTGENNFIDHLLSEIVEEKLALYKPKAIGLTCPFPGNVYSAFKIAQLAKKNNKKITTILGGGYVNTELRSLTDRRPFEFIDQIVFDDGEKAVELILSKTDQRLRTMSLEKDKAQLKSDKLSPADLTDTAFKNHPGPDYSGLPLQNYFSMLEMPNVMHRMWSDFRWNKLILAHGCYWKKCTFCDISLDYI